MTMSRLLIAVFLFWYSLLSVAGTSESSGSQEIMAVKGLEKMQNRVIPETGDWYSNVRSKIECSTYCAEHPECMSVFYLHIENTCILHSIVYVSTRDTEPSDETSYYIVGNYKTCPIELGFFHQRTLDFCYQVFFDVANMTEASRNCSETGALFGFAFNEEQYEHITSLLNGSFIYRKRTFFTGIVLNDSQYVFHYDKTVPEFVRWTDGEQFNEECVGTSSDLGWAWKTIPCHQSKAFVCWYPMTGSFGP